MQTKALFLLGNIIATSFAIGLLPAQPAQAVNLVSNGTFAGATVNGGTNPGYINGAVTTSAYLGDPNVSLPGWSFPINSLTPSNGDKGFNFLVKYGTQIHSPLAAQDGCSPPFSSGPGFSCTTSGLVGSRTILDPVTNSSSGWFIAADAYFDRGAINTTVNGLIAGNKYTVSFYQATGQQLYQNPSNFSDYFDVSFGGTTQKSATMSYSAGSDITPWTLQSLNFTATTATQTLSFLAQSPNDVPPFALLSNVSVEAVTSSTQVPEPENYIGTLICMGFVVKLIKSRLENKKLSADD